jgi:hypothetical protein
MSARGITGFLCRSSLHAARIRVQSKYPGRSADELVILAVDTQGNRRRCAIMPAHGQLVARQPQVE